jgi:hypothetical protein
MEMKIIPVYTFCECPKKYDGHEIKDWNMYLVKILEFDDVYKNDLTIIYGLNLKRLDLKHEILEYLEPSIEKNNEINNLIEKLYNSNVLQIGHKKFIINKLIGMTCKKINKKTKSFLCNNYDNAEILKKKNNDNGYVLEFENNNFFYVMKNEKLLKNGFLPIDIFVKDLHRFRLYEMKNKLKNYGFEIQAYKVDAIHVKYNSHYLNLLQEYMKENPQELYDNEFKKIGSISININVEKIFKNVIEKKNKMYIECHENVELNTIDIEDEYNPNFDKILNKTIIYANQPGAGKSTLCIKYALFKKLKTCIITPYNSTVKEMKKKIKELDPDCDFIEVKTFHMFFGLDHNNIQLNKNFDENHDYNLIIFEEIFTLDSRNLHRINEYMNEHKRCTCIANGDINQLESIDDPLPLKKKYEMVNYMFRNHVYLNISKRFKSEKFNKISKLIKNFKGNEADEKKLISHIIYTYFKNNLIKNLNNFDIEKCITYYNESRTKMNEYIHKKKYGNEKYFVGLELICKSYITNKKIKERFYRNFTYKITKIENDTIFLSCDTFVENVGFDKSEIDKKFTLPYSITNHCCQGMTIEDKYCIFDIFSKHVNLKFFYVAISRCTDLENIYFFTGSLLKEFETDEERLNRQ